MLDGTKILRETWVNNTLIPIYDNEDSVCGIVYNNEPFYFQKNLYGDVIGIVDKDATVVVKYTYDAWGVCTIVSDTSGVNISSINPFRYRGYYYDSETRLYYILNRYYDPTIGRFLNTDKYIGAYNDLATYVLYSYCGNCPVSRYDKGGFFWAEVWDGAKNLVREGFNWGNKFLVSLGVDTAAIGAKALMMYQDSNGIYHASFDCWQQYAGYNDFYDFMFDIGTSMKNEKFRFRMNGKDYAFWAWKGSYINLGAGAELGIYFGGDPHWLVDKGLSMNMTMKLRYNGKQIISYSAWTWWITGFNPNYLYKSASDLKATYTVIFNTKAMYTALKNSKYGYKWSYTAASCYSNKYKATFTF